MIEKVLAVGLSNATAVTGLAAVVFVTTRVWRHAPLAHFLWLAVLVKLVMPPSFHLPVIIPAASQSVAGADTSSTRSMEGGGPSDLVATRSQAPMASRTGDNTEDPPRHDQEHQGACAKDQPHAGPAFAPVATNEDHTSRGIFAVSWLTWHRATFAVWLTGALAMMATVQWRVSRFRLLLRHAVEAPPELREEVASLAQLARVRILPNVRVTGARTAPLVFGTGKRAVLLLPKSLLSSLNDDERATILAHELAHLYRRDHWLTWFELLVVSIYWWHPVAWFARRQLRRAADQCCDGWVMKWFPNQALAYAESMMKTVEFLCDGGRPGSALARGFGQLDSLQRRLQMVVENHALYRLPAREARHRKDPWRADWARGSRSPGSPGPAIR